MKGRTPGATRSRPHKHRARDAGEPADLRLVTGLQHASMLRGVGVRGSGFVCKDEARGSGVPRALVIGATNEMDDDAPGVAKNTGGGALACRAGALRARRLAV